MQQNINNQFVRVEDQNRVDSQQYDLTIQNQQDYQTPTYPSANFGMHHPTQNPSLQFSNSFGQIEQPQIAKQDGMTEQL